MVVNYDPKKHQEKNDTADTLPSMTLPEIQEALGDESHPLHEDARRQATDTAKSFASSFKQYTDNIASHNNVSDALKQITKQPSYPHSTDPTGPTPFEVPTHPGVDLSSLTDSKWMDGLEDAMQSQAERERRQDENAGLSLEAMQTVVAQMLQLNEKIAEVKQRLEDDHASSTKLNQWVLMIAFLTLVATIVGIFT